MVQFQIGVQDGSLELLNVKETNVETAMAGPAARGQAAGSSEVVRRSPGRAAGVVQNVGGMGYKQVEGSATARDRDPDDGGVR